MVAMGKLGEADERDMQEQRQALNQGVSLTASVSTVEYCI